MKIELAGVLVGDQDRALRFYTGVLGFVKRHENPMGGPRWPSAVSPEATIAIFEDTCGNPIQIFRT